LSQINDTFLLYLVVSRTVNRILTASSRTFCAATSGNVQIPFSWYPKMSSAGGTEGDQRSSDSSIVPPSTRRGEIVLSYQRQGICYRNSTDYTGKVTALLKTRYVTGRSKTPHSPCNRGRPHSLKVLSKNDVHMAPCHPDCKDFLRCIGTADLRIILLVCWDYVHVTLRTL